MIGCIPRAYKKSPLIGCELIYLTGQSCESCLFRGLELEAVLDFKYYLRGIARKFQIW